MTIVVTGCRGQLGAELCRQFGSDAVGLDLPEFDLTDRPAVLASLARLRPRAVINTAAYTLVDRAEQESDRCRAINVDGVANLIEACRQLDCALVQISTDYVFGQDRSRTTPYRETDVPGPQGVYAQSKLDGERAASEWPKHLIVRTCGLYGRLAERSVGKFVETMLRLATMGKRLRVVNDQRCTPTYTAHVVRAIRFLLDVDARGVFHVTNAGHATWYEFACEIFRRSGLTVAVDPIASAEWGAPCPRPGYSVLDGSKYLALANRPALPPWQAALAEYLHERA
jgi:dTDP-4-dehydrorhamnose reductase